MNPAPKLGEILLEAGVIDSFQLRSALGEQQRWGGRLGITLIKLGFLEEPDLVRALATQLGLPTARLEGKRVEPEVLSLLPAPVAEEHMVLPLFLRKEGGIRTLYLGMEDPCDLSVMDELRFRTGLQIKPVLMAPSELAEGIDRFYRRRDDGEDQTDELAIDAEEPAAVIEAEEPAAATQPDEPVVATRPEAGVDAPPPEPQAPTEPPGPRVAAVPEAPAPAPASSPAATQDQSTRLILRALADLLIEKGLLEKSELLERVRVVQARKDA